MSIALATLWMIGAGGLIALQAPLNAVLGRAVGNLPGAAISFGIGTLALAALALLLGGGFGRAGTIERLPLVYLLGGVLGAAFVVTALVTIGTLGAVGVTAANVVGQFTAAMVIDTFGWLGVERVAVDPQRLLGIALLGAGTFLVVRSVG